MGFHSGKSAPCSMPIFQASSVPKISFATVAAASGTSDCVVTANAEPPQFTWVGSAASHCGSGAARTPGDPAAWQAAGDAAATIPRAAILARYADRPDMDLGLVPAMVLQPYADRDPLARLARPRLSRAQMLAYRYQLFLSGFDVCTNFMWAANSNSVVLKE